MDSILISLFLIIILVIITYIYLIWNFNYWKKRGISGPQPKPLFGNVPNCILLKRNPAYDIHDIYRQYRRKEKFVGIFKGRAPLLLLIDPSLVRNILTTNFKYFQDNESTVLINKNTDPLFARNPFFLNREDWKEKRMQIIPSLTTKKISGMYFIMLNVARKMNEFLVKRTESNPNEAINAKDLFSRFTAQNMSDCVYGVDANAFSDSDSQLKALAKKLSDKYSWMQTYSTLLEFPIIRQILKSPMMTKRMEEFFMNLSQSTMKVRKESTMERTDFLQYLMNLKDKKNLNNLDLASHSAALFLDGFETSSITMTQCINMLARNKRVQDKLREELVGAVDEKGEISFETLTELPYLDQCINETLRMFSPGKEISKVCSMPFEMITTNGNPVTIEVGTSIQIPLYSLHRDEDYYYQPDEFIPERFSIENGGAKYFREQGVFLPFGDGPRVCSGMKFALTQVKLAVAEVVKNFEIILNSKSKPEVVMDRLSFLCLPDGGVWINLRKLN